MRFGVVERPGHEGAVGDIVEVALETGEVETDVTKTFSGLGSLFEQ